MSITNTTLSGTITSTQTVITLAAGTGLAVGRFVKIDSEFVTVQDVTNSPTILVERGQNSTLAVAHNTGATASIGLPSDFLIASESSTAANMASYNAASAVAIPKKDQVILIGGGSATALTLASATAAYAGVTLTFVAISAQAHTLTYTPGFNGDTTSSDVVTFGSKVGAGFSCTCGPTGLWGNPVLSTGTTIA